mgnify:CR=1 FL=1
MSGEHISVMVVDDHPMWRDGVARDLEAAGFEVVATADGVDAARRRAGATTPDVVLMDMHLPDGNGAEATAAVLAVSANSRVLVLSASAEREDGLDAQRQQDAGQHRPGQGRRDRGHEVAEPRHQPGQHDQDARRHERADRGGPPALDGAGGHQERGARGGPGQRDRGAVPQREPEHPQGLGDAERQQTRRRLGRGGADSGQPGEHDDEGGGEPDDGRDHPRGDRGPLLVHGVSCEVVPFRLRNRL